MINYWKSEDIKNTDNKTKSKLKELLKTEFDIHTLQDYRNTMKFINKMLDYIIHFGYLRIDLYKDFNKHYKTFQDLTLEIRTIIDDYFLK